MFNRVNEAKWYQTQTQKRKTNNERHKPDARDRSQEIRSSILSAQSWKWCGGDLFSKNMGHRYPPNAGGVWRQSSLSKTFTLNVGDGERERRKMVRELYIDRRCKMLRNKVLV